MSGAGPDDVWRSETAEVIDWGPTESHLGLRWVPSGEPDLTIPDDMWGAPEGKGTAAPATGGTPPEHRPGLYVVPSPIAVSPPVPPPERRHLDAAALDALVEMDGKPRAEGPAGPPRRQWRPGRSR